MERLTHSGGNQVEGDSDDWSFGQSAGFYVDALEPKWADSGYMMYSYIVNELPNVIKENFPNADTSRSSIMGHSMGGHGALTIALRVSRCTIFSSFRYYVDFGH